MRWFLWRDTSLPKVFKRFRWCSVSLPLQRLLKSLSLYQLLMVSVYRRKLIRFLGLHWQVNIYSPLTVTDSAKQNPWIPNYKIQPITWWLILTILELHLYFLSICFFLKPSTRAPGTYLIKQITRALVTWPRREMRHSSVTVYPKKYAHGFVVLCFVVVTQSFIMNSHEVLIHIHQGCFAVTGAIVRLPQCQWSKPDGYGKISQCITTTKHSKAKTVCIFLGIYCMYYVSKAVDSQNDTWSWVISNRYPVSIEI